MICMISQSAFPLIVSSCTGARHSNSENVDSENVDSENVGTVLLADTVMKSQGISALNEQCCSSP